MFQPLHLGRRFFRSIHRKGPSAAEEAWATDQLLPTERDLWLSMSDADRHHAVLVAQQVAATLGQQGTRPVLSAALLHDVGKTVSGLSLYGRVIATLIIAVVGRARAATWTRGFKRRVALYARHPELGAEMLARSRQRSPDDRLGSRAPFTRDGLDCARRGRSRLAGS